MLYHVLIHRVISRSPQILWGCPNQISMILVGLVYWQVVRREFFFLFFYSLYTSDKLGENIRHFYSKWDSLLNSVNWWSSASRWVYRWCLVWEHLRSMNTLSRSSSTPSSTKKSRHQQVTSRLLTSRVTVWIGTSLATSKWSILSDLLVGMSLIHRRYCSAWLHPSYKDRIGSRGCNLPWNW